MGHSKRGILCVREGAVCLLGVSRVPPFLAHLPLHPLPKDMLCAILKWLEVFFVAGGGERAWNPQSLQVSAVFPGCFVLTHQLELHKVSRFG